jgi:carboxypeptidase C (cathepsin A)
MGLDNRLRVFAAAGYYDLATPFLSQQYVLNHLDLPPNLRSNLAFHLYPTGHQIYTSPESLRQLTADVKAFLTGPQR